MQRFEVLLQKFADHFNVRHFPEQPASLYDSGEYFLAIGGKRIRPVLVLMGNELFDEIVPDAYHVGTAVELFHNFTLIHDDIMDNAPLRRNQQTLHEKYGLSNAILAGDVMLVQAYDQLMKIKVDYLRKINVLFNKTAREVCEGQQFDMDFEKREQVGLDEYIRMIELKTSVLLAASLQMGGILGGAGERNLQHLYEFGRNLGIAFQVQDDYLDCFGDPTKFGKQVGGDIMANKKTFLLIKALESANPVQLKALNSLLAGNPDNKVEQMLNIFRDMKVDQWAFDLKEQYLGKAYNHLEEIAVVSGRKEPLEALGRFLVQREY
ncbi:polyprenyl synthetase family protein [Pseudoflavitalea sp. G-6-1-2]|uniref:polyprenyl synthetase family protein n=1 Tax=Pseudoflavitalea sp. G-6-1-2 TaxID=2728841 RepID=UPI00146B8D20|nr:polyprenyl synthetase family protein [Pseudoflavitalea sp. G-6-1-2]NML21928.1 polyprenyl synthetase family protein [Pseudoflavitalea sp. G-6-1-2]